MKYYQSEDAQGDPASVYIAYDNRKGVIEIYGVNLPDPTVVIFPRSSISHLTGITTYAFRPDSATVLNIINALNNDTSTYDEEEALTLKLIRDEVIKEYTL